MMVKTVFTKTAFLMASCASAQTNSFVEVIVEDTIQLEAEEIIYAVGYSNWSITTDTVGIDTTATVAAQTEPAINRLLEIRRLIKTLRLDTLKEFNYTVSAYGILPQQTIFIQFRSMDKLNEFTNRIRAFENVNGTILSKNHQKNQQ